MHRAQSRGARGSRSPADLETEFTLSLWVFACARNHDLFISVVQTSRFESIRSAPFFALTAPLPFGSVRRGQRPQLGGGAGASAAAAPAARPPAAASQRPGRPAPPLRNAFTFCCRKLCRRDAFASPSALRVRTRAGHGHGRSPVGWGAAQVDFVQVFFPFIIVFGSHSFFFLNIFPNSVISFLQS